MRVNLGEIYNDTITLINKIDAKDNPTKEDMYEKRVLNGCMWTLRTERVVNADGTVTIGTTHQVQIPENVEYRPYKEWVALKDRENFFTIRPGDVVIKGVVSEEIDSGTVLRKVMANYEPDAFNVQMFRDATKGAGFEHSVSGILRFTEPYIIEG